MKEHNVLQSRAKITNKISIPPYLGEKSMIPFCLSTLNGLPSEFINLASSMLNTIKANGKGFFTIHGKVLKKMKPKEDQVNILTVITNQIWGHGIMEDGKLGKTGIQ